jgi:DNA processing protein
MKYLYAFSLMGLGPATLKKLKLSFGNFSRAWQASSSELLKAKIKETTINKIKSAQNKIDANKEWAKFQKTTLKIITIDDSQYPQQLREIKSAPFILFYSGNISLLSKKQLAVVGTRRHTNYGQMVTEKIIPQITQAGIVITSGLAQGIDSLAHQACLDSKQPTIAVLGAGILEAKKNNYTQRMMTDILSQNSLIVSEYPPNYPASRFTFPARNRIVSGLSLGTLVIEGGLKSGTLITANYALEQNREVFAVPGNIFSDKSTGTHQLIKNGAQVVTSANDILEVLNFSPIQSNIFDQPKIEFTDPEEKIIYQKLSLDPIIIDKLARLCKLDSTTIATKLSLLELKGLARNIGGGRFIKGI